MQLVFGYRFEDRLRTYVRDREVANVRDERTVLHLWNLDASVRISRQLEAFVSVPWAHMSFRMSDDLAPLLPGANESADANVSDPEHRPQQLTQLGDISAAGRYVVFPRQADRSWDLALMAGVVFPTGSTRFDAHHFDLEAGTTLQLGNGIFMPLVGVFYRQSFGRLALHANTIAQLALYAYSKSCQYGKGPAECQEEKVLRRQEELCGRPCVLVDRHQPASTLLLQIGGTYAPESLSRFGFGLSLEAIVRTPEGRDGTSKDAVTGEPLSGDPGLRPISNTGGVDIYVTPTVRARIVDGLVFLLKVQLPIYRYANAHPDLKLKGALVADFVFNAMLSYEFWPFQDSP